MLVKGRPFEVREHRHHVPVAFLHAVSAGAGAKGDRPLDTNRQPTQGLGEMLYRLRSRCFAHEPTLKESSWRITHLNGNAQGAGHRLHVLVSATAEADQDYLLPGQGWR